MQCSQFAVAAMMISGMGQRPAPLVGADGQAGYRSKLTERLGSSQTFAALRDINMPGCDRVAYASGGYREFSPDDAPGDGIYAEVAEKPAVFEAITVSGCGKAFTTHILVYRALDTHVLSFGGITAGETGAGMTLQMDTFETLNGFVAQTFAQRHPEAAGQAPVALIVDTQRVTSMAETQKEVWTEYFCGYLYTADVEYAPAADGSVAINIGLHDGETPSSFRVPPVQVASGSK